MSDPSLSDRYALVLVGVTAARPMAYSLEDAARLANLHPEMLRFYCQQGFFGEARTQPESELFFDDDALYELRRFEHYRRCHGVNRKALRMIAGLSREVERLQNELRFLRGL